MSLLYYKKKHSLCAGSQFCWRFAVYLCCCQQCLCVCFLFLFRFFENIIEILNIKWLFKVNKIILNRTLVVEEKPRRAASPRRSKRYIKGPKKITSEKQNIWAPQISDRDATNASQNYAECQMYLGKEGGPQ